MESRADLVQRSDAPDPSPVGFVVLERTVLEPGSNIYGRHKARSSCVVGLVEVFPVESVFVYGRACINHTGEVNLRQHLLLGLGLGSCSVCTDRL